MKPDKESLEAIGIILGHRGIKPVLTDHFGNAVGFLLVLAEVGPPGSGLAFVSNFDREDLVPLLQELLLEVRKPLDYTANVRDEDIPKL